MKTVLDNLTDYIHSGGDEAGRDAALSAFAQKFFASRNSPVSLVVSRSQILRIHPLEIFWVEAKGQHSVFHTVTISHEQVECCYDLHQWENRLLPYGFIRICRDAIINFNCIESVTVNPLLLVLRDH